MGKMKLEIGKLEVKSPASSVFFIVGDRIKGFPTDMEEDSTRIGHIGPSPGIPRSWDILNKNKYPMMQVLVSAEDRVIIHYAYTPEREAEFIGKLKEYHKAERGKSGKTPIATHLMITVGELKTMAADVIKISPMSMEDAEDVVNTAREQMCKELSGCELPAKFGSKDQLIGDRVRLILQGR